MKRLDSFDRVKRGKDDVGLYSCSLPFISLKDAGNLNAAVVGSPAPVAATPVGAQTPRAIVSAALGLDFVAPRGLARQ